MYLLTDGKKKVGFAQARVSVNEEGVIGDAGHIGNCVIAAACANLFEFPTMNLSKV